MTTKARCIGAWSAGAPICKDALRHADNKETVKVAQSRSAYRWLAVLPLALGSRARSLLRAGKVVSS